MNTRATASKTAAEMLLAFVSASVWFVILFAVSYPVEQWLGVVAIAYVSLCVSRLAIANAAVFTLAKLQRRGEESAGARGDRARETEKRPGRRGIPRGDRAVPSLRHNRHIRLDSHHRRRVDVSRRIVPAEPSVRLRRLGDAGGWRDSLDGIFRERVPAL